MVAQGPCLRHCCRRGAATVWAARAALVYSLACAGYLVLTRDYGTPFLDSLTPAQREIKRASARRRGDAFWASAALAAALVAAWRPFAHASSTM